LGGSKNTLLGDYFLRNCKKTLVSGKNFKERLKCRLLAQIVGKG